MNSSATVDATDIEIPPTPDRTLARCEDALARLSLDRRDVVATFTFGSVAKGESSEASDLDVIFFLAEASAYPSFRYERLIVDGVRIDANAVKFDRLDALCRSAAGWSYRIHRLRCVPELTRVSSPDIRAWTTSIDALVEHPLAFRARLLRHIRECRGLIRCAERVGESDRTLAAYFELEIAFLAPLIFLNSRQVVPFMQGNPWGEALRVAATAGDAGRAYETLAVEIASGRLSCVLNHGRDFGKGLKRFRDDCRSLVIARLGNIYGSRYDETLMRAFSADAALREDLAALCQDLVDDALPRSRQLWTWLEVLRRPLRASRLPAGKPTTLRRRKRKDDGVRHIHYEADAARLKVIIPTGGCRVPTCHFCMLPYLARSKTPIEEVLSEIEGAGRDAPVRKLAIYTDGSFFDPRELSSKDCRSIGRSARALGVQELLVESLPRFLTRSALGELQDSVGADCRLRIGIGVQSTDPRVRVYVTGTPIEQRELLAVLKWRQSDEFALRLYLLANKLLMGEVEDLRDVQASLAFLNPWLRSDDIVTVNPLLPTSGTLLEAIERHGFWRRQTDLEVEAMKAVLSQERYTFQLGFGPNAQATCNELEYRRPDEPPARLSIPWAVLGGLRHRHRWATRGGLSDSG